MILFQILLTFLGYTIITLLLMISLDDLPIDQYNKYFYWKFFGWPIYFPLWLVWFVLKTIYCDIIIKTLDNISK